MRKKTIPARFWNIKCSNDARIAYLARRYFPSLHDSGLAGIVFHSFTKSAEKKYLKCLEELREVGLIAGGSHGLNVQASEGDGIKEAPISNGISSLVSTWSKIRPESDPTQTEYIIKFAIEKGMNPEVIRRRFDRPVSPNETIYSVLEKLA